MNEESKTNKHQCLISPVRVLSADVRYGMLWQQVVDVVKIDVEAAEWPFLRNLVDVEPTQSDYIRQLLLEIHTPYVKPRQLNRSDLVEMIYYIVRLSELGFTVVRNRQENNCCRRFSPIMPKSVREKCCYKTFYINTRL